MKRHHLLLACLFLTACGGSGSDGSGGGASSSEPASSPLPSAENRPRVPRPVDDDPQAWALYFVSSFDEVLVAAVRETAAFVDHALRVRVRLDGHPIFGGAGRVVEMNPLVEARVDYAHSVGLTGAGQLLSMIDSVPRFSHEQFSGKSVYTTGSGPTDSHGTAVASVMVGIGAGTSTGVAPGADLHVGVLDFNGPVPFSSLARAMRDARSLGAVASNNSWGISGVTAANTDLRSLFSSPGRADYIQSLREFSETGVIVFSAGNDYDATSVNGMAALPLAFPELEGSWIAVVNAIPDMVDGEIVSATRLSSACLEAARWCITANGQIRAASGPSPTSP